ncbi:DEAD/DEAH box helicase [Enterococcus hirae]|uniref:Helicase n=2 Tax=Enterococcus hirae TaxID=1354 RepID=A0A7Z9AV37_ENTHR|nr:DEAD/DEAH box helicase [Enterococcus hirae]OWW70070.1 DNA helicase [Enterococcus hirae 57-09-G6]EMF0043574.1 DEAD/DEAH box helicase family protein [Enterococcus hirae]EMF0053141.1 DEAD/DEAH box helicase family protein [Enterococcus hirae]EMF0055781.1 DEAD/DEAH box helicase family protein [Enterococcus hirae]EMF0068594.1 DEAD/DEAH box helicase family protein [Enterococcus hirae]
MKKSSLCSLYGRRLLTRDLREWTESFEQIRYQKLAAIHLQGNWLTCNRCSMRTKIGKSEQKQPIIFCPVCLFLGRCDNTQELFLFEQPELPKRNVCFTWTGKLTPTQQAISTNLVTDVSGKQHMIWAVTGAGKTEMLYEKVIKTLEKGGRVALVSPRVDVCNELYLRFCGVFPEEDIVLLHGKKKEAYRFSPFVIATTHQLYRFYQTFDLLVVDEVDAFPFAGDPGLAYAVETAIKPKGTFIYLSATPNEQLLKKIRSTFLIHQLPLRFHQRLLPEPHLFFWNDWPNKCLKEKKLRPLLKCLNMLLQQNHVLLFCPSIALMNRLASLLKRCLPMYRITDASAKDPNRSEKVQQMRKQQYDVLLTTMILERGVTFANVSVIVLGADHRVFTKSSLVQIAGRADRKGDFTNSQVYFFYEELTKAIKLACREIKEMNRQGKKQLAMKNSEPRGEKTHESL